MVGIVGDGIRAMKWNRAKKQIHCNGILFSLDTGLLMGDPHTYTACLGLMMSGRGQERA